MTTAVHDSMSRVLSWNMRGEFTVERWRSERPLFVLSVIVSVLLWLVLIITIVGLVYGLLAAVFFFVMQLAFVAHIRGNGVRLSAAQFPELYAHVHDIAQRMGMERVPDIYLIQAGGSLNAFATRFLRSHMIVLFTDLLEACGDDEAARDMIIGHELGHIHAGHLRWRWLLLPSAFLPFLGSALSRAREYTCDRYGYASAGDHDGALLGLAILAAGGTHGRRVNLDALVSQRADLNTGWMTIGTWLGSHPPLAARLAALDDSLAAEQRIPPTGALRAWAILGLLLLPVLLGGWLVGRAFMERVADAAARIAVETDGAFAPAADAAEQLERNVRLLSSFLASHVANGNPLPVDAGELEDAWYAAYPDLDLPVDPYDGEQLGYTRTAEGYTIWSSGPDTRPSTDDDIVFPFR